MPVHRALRDLHTRNVSTLSDIGHTYAFDDTVAWLTVRCSKTAVRVLMRVAWRTVTGRIETNHRRRWDDR